MSMIQLELANSNSDSGRTT